jgi:exportin-T
MSSSSDQFISAIQALFNPSTPNHIKHQAESYVQQLKQSNDGWKLLLTELHHVSALQSSESLNVIFYCLQGLNEIIQERYFDSFSPEDKAALRESLMVYVGQVAPKYKQSRAVKLKLCNVLVTVVQLDYPNNWPSFFQDFIQLINNSNNNIEVIDVFVKLLLVLDEEIVRFDESRPQSQVLQNSAIKDHMRESNTMPLIINTLYAILESYHTTQTALTISTLDTLAEYIGWIDINLIANEKWLKVFYFLLQNRQFQAAAAKCLREIVCKNMDLNKKCALIQSIGIIPILQQVNQSINKQSAEFCKAIADLIDNLGQNLIESIQLSEVINNEIQPTFLLTLLEIIEVCLQLGYSYFELPRWEIGEQIIEFYIAYVKLMKEYDSKGDLTAFINTTNNTNNNAQDNNKITLHTPEIHLRRIFICLSKGLEYPAEYDHENAQDDEIKYDAYHGQCLQLLAVATDCNQNVILECATDRMMDCINHSDVRSAQFIEASLIIFFELGAYVNTEELAASQSAVIGVKGKANFTGSIALCSNLQPFRSILSALFKSNLSYHSFGPVNVVYINIIFRYAKFLECNPAFISDILKCLLDNRGIHNSYPKARGRACYQLCMLLRNCPDETKAHFKPFLDEMLKQIQAAIQPILNQAGLIRTNTTYERDCVKKGLLTIDDVMHLCESMGFLLSSNSTGEMQGQYVATVINYFKKEIDKFVIDKSWLNTLEQERVANKLSVLIESLAHVCKPLVKDGAKLFDILSSVYSSVINCILLIPTHSAVRKSCVTFTYQMISCINFQILPALPTLLQTLIQDASMGELDTIISLINFLANKFRQQFVPILEPVVLPLCQAVFAFIQQFDHVANNITNSSSTANSNGINTSVAYSTDRIDRKSLQRLYYTLMIKLTNPQMQVYSVFLSEKNFPSFFTIFQSIAMAYSNQEPDTEKNCFTCYRQMIQVFLSALQTSSPQQHNILQFIHNNITQLIYSSLFSANLNLANASYYNVFKEALSLQRDICALFQNNLNEYLNHLGQLLCNQYNLSQANVQQYIQLLQQGDFNKLTEFWKQLKVTNNNSANRAASSPNKPASNGLHQS